ncbi:hypothetical protein LINPERPRIM_LOCUS30655 [Linum perenne]
MGSLFENLGWIDLVGSQESLYYPDAVYQFYANMQLTGPISNGFFSTYVDGYLIYVTVEMLNVFLGAPNQGVQVNHEVELEHFDFNYLTAVNGFTGANLRLKKLTLVKELPDRLKVLHFFITRVFLPRTFARDIITPLDAWIMKSTQMGRKLSYAHLMFAHMAQNGKDLYQGHLPFAPQISGLLICLGLKFHNRYSEQIRYDKIRVQHVLRLVEWTGCRIKPGNNTGGEDSSSVVDYKKSWSDRDYASDYESDPKYEF